METNSNNRGGKRVNAGRKKGLDTVVLSYRVTETISIVLDKEIKALIAKHTNVLKQSVKHYDCDCAVIGYTVGGKEIVRVCKLHR